jgi:hypothetical protein
MRDEVVVANKLWWEHWPEEDAQAELDGSLGRKGFDHVDLIYAVAPPRDFRWTSSSNRSRGCSGTGRARAWGTCMWTGAQHLEALDVCEQLNVPAPAAAQMATSLVEHSSPDDPDMVRAFARPDRTRRKQRLGRRSAHRQVSAWRARTPRRTRIGARRSCKRSSPRRSSRLPSSGTYRRRMWRSPTRSHIPTLRACSSARVRPGSSWRTSPLTRRSNHSPKSSSRRYSLSPDDVTMGPRLAASGTTAGRADRLAWWPERR